MGLFEQVPGDGARRFPVSNVPTEFEEEVEEALRLQLPVQADFPTRAVGLFLSMSMAAPATISHTMSPRRKTLALASALILAPLLALAALVAAAVMLFEAGEVEQGSIQHILGVPSSIRSVAHTVQACSPPLWQWKGRDGLSSPYVAMRYGSTAALAEVLQQHTAALSPLSCTADGEPQLLGSVVQRSMNCGHDDVAAASISIGGRVDANDTGCREVTLYFLESY